LAAYRSCPDTLPVEADLYVMRRLQASHEPNTCLQKLRFDAVAVNRKFVVKQISAARPDRQAGTGHQVAHQCHRGWSRLAARARSGSFTRNPRVERAVRNRKARKIEAAKDKMTF
jgi:hypothetical protein